MSEVIGIFHFKFNIIVIGLGIAVWWMSLKVSTVEVYSKSFEPRYAAAFENLQVKNFKINCNSRILNSVTFTNRVLCEKKSVNYILCKTVSQLGDTIFGSKLFWKNVSFWFVWSCCGQLEWHFNCLTVWPTLSHGWCLWHRNLQVFAKKQTADYTENAESTRVMSSNSLSLDRRWKFRPPPRGLTPNEYILCHRLLNQKLLC